MILFISLFLYIRHLDQIVQNRFEALTWDIPSKVYSDHTPVFPGLNVQTFFLERKLNRLGYQKMMDPPTRVGTYQIEQMSPSEMVWKIYLNAFDYPTGAIAGILVKLLVSENMVLEIKNEKDEDIYTFNLEPELITEFFRGIRSDRTVVRLEAVPANLLNAIIAIEDTRFLEHSGVDPKGILRAFLSNLKAGGIVQGGSTLTQQLVKNFFLTQKRSYIRKINEAFMALLVESRYSKDKILEAYINEVYLGQRGAASIHGMALAAKHYFAKDLEDLTLSESAMLAGIIQNPWLHSPYRRLKNALQRRNLVLDKMFENGLILKPELEAAKNETLYPKQIQKIKNIAPYFVDFVKRELSKDYSQTVLTTQGLRIFTTLDPDSQITANEAVQKTLQALEVAHPNLKTEVMNDQLQAALIALEPQTGFIRAITGGRDFDQTQFNRVVQAKRQPGSLFKPIVFLTAFEEKPAQYTLVTKRSTAPFTHTYHDQTWTPQNYEEETKEETVTLRRAIEKSINIPTAHVAIEVGISKIAKKAMQLGIHRKILAVPSIALGSIEVSPLEMATVYGTLANQGVRATPISIKYITDSQGKILESHSVHLEKVASLEAVYLITHALQGVIQQGTGLGVKYFGLEGPLAGKTGTSNEYMDAWFAGYTPNLVAVSWVGLDQEKSLGLTGAQAALPLWARFMKHAIHLRPQGEFEVPENSVSIKLDPETLEVATKKCPETFEEVFIEGTQPKATCHLHPEKKKKEKK
ncbi:MAG: hypothetical protein A3B70_07720 [Deltaproteobacteria bacterium RIFCSPHIGHO2_02_FULL_40_11]|nr:MAG: hypothetical protein A3B70_07720 [Deltaproteobacteria bacterium RIFCSPHIGHO2_02_FULL_40_11]